jgi:hypothetical protein
MLGLDGDTHADMVTVMHPSAMLAGFQTHIFWSDAAVMP